jgi:hypothetical protein
MTTLRIDHPVTDFAAWKKMFDADPLGRKASGVRSYRVLVSDDGQAVTIDLDFDDEASARSFQLKLGELWASGPVTEVLRGQPGTRLLELKEEVRP